VPFTVPLMAFSRRIATKCFSTTEMREASARMRPVYPGLQTQSEAYLEPLRESELAGHCVAHDAAANILLYMPGAHKEHVSEPGARLKVPGGHAPQFELSSVEFRVPVLCIRQGSTAPYPSLQWAWLHGQQPPNEYDSDRVPRSCPVAIGVPSRWKLVAAEIKTSILGDTDAAHFSLSNPVMSA